MLRANSRVPPHPSVRQSARPSAAPADPDSALVRGFASALRFGFRRQAAPSQCTYARTPSFRPRGRLRLGSARFARLWLTRRGGRTRNANSVRVVARPTAANLMRARRYEGCSAGSSPVAPWRRPNSIAGGGLVSRNADPPSPTPNSAPRPDRCRRHARQLPAPPATGAIVRCRAAIAATGAGSLASDLVARERPPPAALAESGAARQRRRA